VGSWARRRGITNAKLGVLARKGVGVMGGEKRGRVEVDRKRITEIYLQYCRNIRENKEAMWFSAEDYGGVPKDVIGRCKLRELGKGEEGKS
jgi:hypothetical protein